MPLKLMGNFAEDLACTYGAKTAAVGGGEAVWIVPLQKVTAVFGNGRNALHHFVFRLKRVLRQYNVTNLGRGVVVNGRVQQDKAAFGKSRVHGTAVYPAALPARQQQFGVSKQRGCWQRFEHLPKKENADHYS